MNRIQMGPATPRYLNLSPDSVTLRSVHMSSQVLDAPTKRQDLNIPPLLTPLRVQKEIQHIDEHSANQDQAGMPRLPPPVPKLPPRSSVRKPLSRSKSECNVDSRRSIFGQYWNTTARMNSNSHVSDTERVDPTTFTSPPQPLRKRSSSMSIIESTALPETKADYRTFAPSIDHARKSPICGRFHSVETVPALDSFPPLPSPLRRLCSEGSGSGGLHGMYPLVTPVPILRQSSYRSLLGTKEASTETAHLGTNVSAENPNNLNLTKSWHPLRQKTSSFETVSSTSSCHSETSSSKVGVRFDPRITVTEFEDCVERSWYDDKELESLKQETLMVAQEYLLTHAEEADKYNRATLDPVTGTLRKKALFSLPALSFVPDDDPRHCDYQSLMKDHLRTILVVDSNRSLLGLFRLSMGSMFPQARILTTASSEEALRLVSSALVQEQNHAVERRHFDLIIVEQHLNGIRNTSGKGNSNGVQLNCGSDLLKMIRKLERQAFEQSAAENLKGRSLLIGVSMQPDRDAVALRRAGADVVWGKPIPRVGEGLRNQLIKALLHKRSQSIASTHAYR